MSSSTQVDTVSATDDENDNDDDDDVDDNEEGAGVYTAMAIPTVKYRSVEEKPFY